MPEEFEELDIDIEELLQPQEKKKRGAKTRTYELPGTKRKIKFDPNIRTVWNWFKLPHTMTGACQVPSHDETRQARDAAKLYYIDDNGLEMCRWCFVESRDLSK